jgi:PmbA protein
VSASRLEEAAANAVQLARDLGATDAECTIVEGDEFSTNIRLGEVEQLKQASSCEAGIRVLVGKCTGSSYTSDLTKEGVETMVRAALALANITTDDDHAGMPEEFGQWKDDLRLYDTSLETMETSDKIDRAMKAEKAALDFDPRIQNSEGAGFDSYVGVRVFANSRGFLSSYRTTSAGMSVVPVAKQNGSMERDYWNSAGRHLNRLETPESIGKRAAERALRRLNPRKVLTQKVPIVFEPRTARSLLGDVFDAVNGASIYRHASFLTGKLGEKIASENLTVVDDATMPGLFGSCPFDDEGVASRRTMVIERGVLKSYLLNSYCARKLGLKSTGNASRGVTGNAGIGPGNFYVEAGELTEEQILSKVSNGLYVTELIGASTSTVTGDYSSGAVGIWIENGELAYPVSEITVAGNLKAMLKHIQYVGSNLDFRGSLASPTILVEEMTVSGQ